MDKKQLFGALCALPASHDFWCNQWLFTRSVFTNESMQTNDQDGFWTYYQKLPAGLRQYIAGAPIGDDSLGPCPQPSASGHDDKDFLLWFGDSLMIDGQGKPLVVYRSGSIEESIRGFFFTDVKSRADQYGEAKPYYLSILNPYITDFNGNTWDEGDGDYCDIDSLAENAAMDGYDGVIAHNVRGNPDSEPSLEVVVFTSSQIRHALVVNDEELDHGFSQC